MMNIVLDNETAKNIKNQIKLKEDKIKNMEIHKYYGQIPKYIKI